jgi:hypothetical protein
MRFGADQAASHDAVLGLKEGHRSLSTAYERQFHTGQFQQLLVPSRFNGFVR